METTTIVHRMLVTIARARKPISAREITTRMRIPQGRTAVYLTRATHSGQVVRQGERGDYRYTVDSLLDTLATLQRSRAYLFDLLKKKQGKKGMSSKALWRAAVDEHPRLTHASAAQFLSYAESVGKVTCDRTERPFRYKM